MPKTILDFKLYTQGETAELLGVSTTTIAKYIKQGRLTFRTIGARHFFSEEDIRKFLRQSD